MYTNNKEVIKEACEIILAQIKLKDPDILCIKEQANLINKYAIRADAQLEKLLGERR